MNTTRDSDSLVAVIAPLAKHIGAIQHQMHALGMFANDRELLDCLHSRETRFETLHWRDRLPTKGQTV